MKTPTIITLVSWLAAGALTASAAGHLVKSGETLGGIAARYHTTPTALRLANSLTGDLIRPGQTLKLPEPTPAPGNGTASGPSHRVKSGETLWSIARHYGLSVKQLQRDNALGESSVIRPGMKLTLRSPAMKQPAKDAGKEPTRNIPKGAHQPMLPVPQDHGVAPALAPLPKP